MKIGNAPCSWGVLEFDETAAVPDYRQVLAEMAETGYQGTELGPWGYLPTDPVELKDLLSGYGLELVAAFVPVSFAEAAKHAEGAREALRIARLLHAISGEEALIVLADDNGKVPLRVQKAGRIQPQDGLSAERWKIYGRGADEVAQRVYGETGLHCAFHHHCAGYVETPQEIEILLDLTNPDFLGLCFDTGHYAYGGGDPADDLSRLAGRIRHLHFKDVDAEILQKTRSQRLDYFAAVQAGIFCEIGKGMVDFPAIAELVSKITLAKWIVVEQDILESSASPATSAKHNRDYLRRINGKFEIQNSKWKI